MTVRAWTPAFAALALFGISASCGVDRGPLNVVVVTLDTTRVDRLTPYGYMDASMPGLERLAREGAVFQRAYTIVPLTLPAHTSLFTGLSPVSHGVHDNADPPLDGQFDTLAEVLHGGGYQTAAFVASAVLDPDRGLAQGFDRYQDTGLNEFGRHRSQRRGDEVMNDAIAWLEHADQRPFLLWTHLYDAHQPYEPPEPFASQISNRYVAEIAFADAQLRRLLDTLDRRGLAGRTVVVVLADHGESLGERGERDHGIFLYDNVMQIPLMIRAPGVAATRVNAIARSIDVMPTILELAGQPARHSDGRSLSPLMRGTDDHREAYAESLYPRRIGWSALASLRDDRYKFIEAPKPELYDLDNDPFEQQNLAATRISTVEAMRRRLEAIASASTPASTPAPVSKELRERLASLGYASSSGAGNARNRDLPDPKDCMAAIAAAALDDTARTHARVPCR